MYNEHDCTDENVYEVELAGRYVIIKEDALTSEYKNEKYQLVLVTRSTGSEPNGTGTHFTVTEVNDDPSTYRLSRNDDSLIGIAKDSVVRAHKDKYL